MARQLSKLRAIHELECHDFIYDSQSKLRAATTNTIATHHTPWQVGSHSTLRAIRAPSTYKVSIYIYKKNTSDPQQ